MSIIHTSVVLIAIFAGLVICGKDKGTRKHRFWGKIYVFSVVLIIATAFMTQELQTRIGAYKIFIILSLLFIAAGFYPLFFRKRIKIWVVWHYTFMLYSFLFLLIAAVTHFIDYFRDFLISLRMIESEANVTSRVLFWFLPFIIGTVWIFSKKRFYESRFRNFMMRPPK